MPLTDIKARNALRGVMFFTLVNTLKTIRKHLELFVRHQVSRLESDLSARRVGWLFSVRYSYVLTITAFQHVGFPRLKTRLP